MINLGELLLLHRVGVSVPCRNGKPIGAIDEYGDVCVCWEMMCQKEGNMFGCGERMRYKPNGWMAKSRFGENL